jgi:Fe-S-cluster containining protein
MEKKKICERCGDCCFNVSAIGAGILVFDEDIKRWHSERRSDILSLITDISLPSGKIITGTEYNGQDIGKTACLSFKSKCPFLRVHFKPLRVECTIHDTKPKKCREFYCSKGKTMS